MYVKNFPDQSTKQMDVINWPKAYSTEYLEMAKRWYLENKDRLILDYDKYYYPRREVGWECPKPLRVMDNSAGRR